MLFAGHNFNRGELMDSFTSLKNKLEATGLYDVLLGTNIYAELKAYAAALDVMFGELDIMLRELFIATAESYGITNRERLLGKERDTYTLEKRREMLIVYEQMMGEKCTKEAFEMVLSGYGLSDFEIVESPADSTVTIDIGDDVPEEIKKMIAERITADFPSHITVEVNFLSDTASNG